eukprot:m.279851 g.279851  ORF g.279851 m.279851 type:complete len:247 (+) comp40627_c0_seq9:3571-4311(+)
MVINTKSMAAYARLTRRDDGQGLTVNIKSSADSSFSHTFDVNSSNSLLLQQKEKVPVGGSLEVSASGTGIALLQASVSYNIDDHKRVKPAYSLTVEVVEKNGGKRLTIKLCSTYKLNKASGMVMVSGTMPSGFAADTDALDKYLETNSVVQRYEVNDNRVDMYLDEIAYESTKCVEIFAFRQFDVGKLQPVNAEVFSYYEPDLERVSQLYIPSQLADIHVCDLCECHDTCIGCETYQYFQKSLCQD